MIELENSYKNLLDCNKFLLKKKFQVNEKQIFLVKNC